MTDHTYSTHISCPGDWQPTWQSSSVDVMYMLHILCSNWFIILVVSLAATPSAGDDPVTSSVTPIKVDIIPRYLDKQSCLAISGDSFSCNCSESPPELNIRPPWERGTTTTVSSTIPWMPPMTSTPVIPDTTTAATSTTDLLVDTPTESETSAIVTSTNMMLISTTTNGITVTLTGDPGSSESVTTTPENSTSQGPRRIQLAFIIIIPILALIVFIIVIVWVITKTQRGRRGRYNIQRALTRVMSRSRNPSPNTNGTANNQSDIEIKAVEQSEKSVQLINGGTPIKNFESDLEEGNVKSQMLRGKLRSSETPEKDNRRSSKTPDNENRRPSRQIRLDSQSPLVANMDESEDDGDLNFAKNGTLEDEMKSNTIQEDDDDAFEDISLEANKS